MECIIHNNRVCKITKVVRTEPDRCEVQIVVGQLTKKSRSGSRPGPGWRPDPSGEARRWVKYVPQYDNVTVMKDDVLETWPVGWQKHGHSATDLVESVKSIVAQAVNSGGLIARRVVPTIPYETFETHFRSNGLVCPTEEEIAAAVEYAWKEVTGRNVKRNPSKGVIMKQTAADKPEFGDVGPDGEKEKHFYSATFEQYLKDTPTNRMKYHAGMRGWPFEGLANATKNRKGVLGVTLAYAVKNDYNHEKFGGTRTEGLEDEVSEESGNAELGETEVIDPGTNPGDLENETAEESKKGSSSQDSGQDEEPSAD